ncbi:MAG TPA: shikimate kinase [Longimicrobium sp.]|jgi:shikimate kinase|nr:shikimate kinase [Longimicrobium sp.]
MAPSPQPIERVVLLGFMAAGKTAVGAELARRLGWEHLDLDREIERREGRSVAAIFAAEGEGRFRELEARATAELASQSQVVVSPGGGWITGAGNLEALGGGTLAVWLRVSPEEAVRRAAASPGERPLLAGADPLEAARRLLEARAPLYAHAGLHVDTEGRSPGEVAAIIQTELRARSGPM